MSATLSIPRHATLVADAPETATCRYCSVEKPANADNFRTFGKGIALYLSSRCDECESAYRDELKARKASGEHVATPRLGRKPAPVPATFGLLPGSYVAPKPARKPRVVKPKSTPDFNLLDIAALNAR